MKVLHEKFRPLRRCGKLNRSKGDLSGVRFDRERGGKKPLAAALLTSFAISLMAVRGEGKTKARRHPENDRDNNNNAVHKYFDSYI